MACGVSWATIGAQAFECGAAMFGINADINYDAMGMSDAELADYQAAVAAKATREHIGAGTLSAAMQGMK